MASISYKKILMDLTGFLSGNDKIYYDFLKLFDTPSGVKVPDDFPVSVKEFYNELDGFRMEWIHADFLDAAFVSGRVNILQSEKLVSDWKDILWFDFTEENDPIRTFRILDFFIDEACVGFYINKNETEALYYYNFHDTPQSLNLDMPGYITMLSAAKGYKFWQKAIISIIENKDNVESRIFKEYMPKIFPTFKYEEFKATYNSIKLK